jgi:hypothetical protein
MIISIVGLTAIFAGIIYSIATSPHPNPIKSVPPQTFTIPDGFTYKLVNKTGWHPCVEDAGVLCKGPYTLNETIQKYQTVHPPPAFPPPGFALPPSS